MTEPSDEHIELLAETLCCAFHKDWAAEPGAVFANLSRATKGHWRRTARAALRAINGNRDWLGVGA